jgi:hypothetical protein
MKHLLLLVRILFESKPFEHFPFSLDNNINVITIRGEEKLETEGSQTNAREYLGFPVAVALPRHPTFQSPANENRTEYDETDWNQQVAVDAAAGSNATFVRHE